MEKEHQIVRAVYAAKESAAKADDLIHSYIPFIRSEATKFMGRLCTEQDDEYSISMMAFYEAIMGYDQGRGTFLGYAALLIQTNGYEIIRGHLHRVLKKGGAPV